MFSNLRYKVVALLTALLLWGVSHSTSSIEQGRDISVIEEHTPASLVVTDRNSETVNVRVRGSPAALRRLSVDALKYPVDLSGAKPPSMKHEVDVTRLQLPRGVQIVSRSPASLEFGLERKSTRAVKVRADIDGEPAAGFEVGDVAIDPPRLRISGARSEVLRVSEVLTETIDVAGADAPLEKKVRATPGGLHVWVDGENEVTVRIEIMPAPVASPDAPAKAKTKRKGKA